MIEIQNVSRRYGSVQALQNVNIHVEKGSVLGLLGQNGAGKTTLLNILTGYLAPSQGRALIGGADTLMEPAEARRHIGYLPEQPPLYDEMTVREYLRFAAELRGVQKRAVPAHTDEVMELTGLTEMRDRMLGHLSKGYRQRAGMAQALCGDPEVLILDEPTVGLDPKQITEVRELVRKLSHGRTIVFSSHILSEVQQLCSHVVILDHGVVKLNSEMSGVHDPNVVTLLVTLGAPQSKLGKRIRELDGVKHVQVHSSANADETTMLITFAHVAEPERRLFALLAAMNVPILHLSRSEDTLEQVFLKTINR